MQSFPVVVRLCRFLKGSLRQYPLSDIGWQRANGKGSRLVESNRNILPVSVASQNFATRLCRSKLLRSIRSVVRRTAALVLAYLSDAERREPCLDFREDYRLARAFLRELWAGSPKPFDAAFVRLYGIPYRKWLTIHATREAQKACDVLLTAWGWVPKWGRGPAQIEFEFGWLNGAQRDAATTPETQPAKVRKAAA